MTKAVFVTKVDPAYDDLPEFQYHFPRTYLGQAEAAVGDWIIYYEPRRTSSNLSSRGGRQSYFATAHLDRIDPDPSLADHFYARVSQYLEFDRDVPFQMGDRYPESRLRRDDGGTNKGLFGRAVRSISDSDYEFILTLGFAPVLKASGDVVSAGVGPAERTRAHSFEPASDSSGEPRALGTRANSLLSGFGSDDSIEEFERPIIERIVARPFRDAAFALAVKEAYQNTCSVTGLKIINGGGRAEVQAAHIKPVAEKGPDSVRNGLALSGTMHWMFDRGLITIADDYSLVLAKGRVPEMVERMINPDGKLRLPADRPDLRPHPQFLRFHRDVVFKG
jgi:putative restriction endonuclease